MEHLNSKTNEITIPTDFESLHELKDLGTKYGAAIKFLETINEYRYSYFESFVKTYDQVLQYIPETQYKLYKVFLLDKELCTFNEFDLHVIKLNEPSVIIEQKNGKYQATQVSYRLVYPNDRVFLIDTINKKVQFCPWIYRRATIRTRQFFNLQYLDVTYDRFTFKIVPEESIFRVVVPLYKKQLYTQEEYMHCAQHGYCPGSQGGYEIHDFCLRTNRYLGFNDQKSYHYYDHEKTFKY